jgi:hypothetical protein
MGISEIKGKTSDTNSTHRNLGASETRRGIETNTITTSRTVNFNFSSVWLESLRRILSCYTALNRKATLRDILLRETQLGQSRAGCNLDLSRNNVDASDFLCGK